MRSHRNASGARTLILLVLFAATALGQSEVSRVYAASVERTWTAAVDVATQTFLVDRIAKDEGTLRLRAGPLRAYAFDVVLRDAGSGRTRVDMVLRSTWRLAAVRKDAHRNADRYLNLLRERLETNPRR